MKSFHDVELPPSFASQAKYGKLLIMKKSTASTTEEMSPEICQPYAMSEIERGMLGIPAFLKSVLIWLMYLAKLEAEPKSLSYKG